MKNCHRQKIETTKKKKIYSIVVFCPSFPFVCALCTIFFNLFMINLLSRFFASFPDINKRYTKFNFSSLSLSFSMSLSNSLFSPYDARRGNSYIDFFYYIYVLGVKLNCRKWMEIELCCVFVSICFMCLKQD